MQTSNGVRGKPGPRPRVIAEPPIPGDSNWDDPAEFNHAIELHMRRHGDTAYGLSRLLRSKGMSVDPTTLRTWSRGVKTPSHKDSFHILGALETRWGLPAGYFAEKIQSGSHALRRARISGLTASEMRRFAWHLPDDFEERLASERQEILEWVRRVAVSGATQYRRYQSEALRYPYGLRCIRLTATQGRSGQTRHPELAAPAELEAELEALVAFKTATLTPPNFARSGIWKPVTALQKVEHLGLMFGAIAASPHDPIRGLGVAPCRLCLGLLAVPQVWDWYLRWREQRRGFYTRWETDMLANAAALTHPRTGWMTQSPALADRLQEIPGLVSANQVDAIRQDWSGACGTLHHYATSRGIELRRLARVHHDPFEPILPVLEAEHPAAEYRRIADEVLRRAPSRRRHPKAAAEAARCYLLIRLGLHLGFRQRNLRELLVSGRGCAPRSERCLVDLQRGELRWSERDAGWEVFAPAVAFKNSGSTFFARKPYRLLLPPLDRLNEHIEEWLSYHRPLLLGGAPDPGVFFVKTAKRSSRSVAYSQTTFYEAWRSTIERYGIFNPWTGRGAIAGLLPHGPHAVRDVLATHVLKQTGSYEQASYAIQDTPEMVSQHYARFLPSDKAAAAARILNRIWE